jgi:uncharacterized protein (DUF2141 family)
MISDRPSRALPVVVAFLLIAAGARAADLDVTIEGVRSARGVLRLCVFDIPRGFPDCAGNHAARHAVLAAHAGRDDILVRALAPGVHAVAVYHDEAGTGRLRTNWLGIPEDGVGASNNPRGLLGPPSFAQAAFTLPAAGGHIVVVLIYP